MKVLTQDVGALRHADRLRAALTSVAGLELTAEPGGSQPGGSQPGESLHRGSLRREESLYHRGVDGEVWIERGESLHLEFPLPAASDAEGALRLSHGLDGNMRIASRAERLLLLADVDWEAGEATGQSIAAITTCVQDWGSLEQEGARGGDSAHSLDPTPSGNPALLERTAVLVAGLGWPEEAIVQHAGNGTWELRPRVHGKPQAVMLSLVGPHGDLRLSRTLLRSMPEQREGATGGTIARALAELALDLNNKVRFARLVEDAGALCVEARLAWDSESDPERNSGRLARAARAVAAISEHCQPLISVLASHRRLAECYLAALTCPEL